MSCRTAGVHRDAEVAYFDAIGNEQLAVTCEIVAPMSRQCAPALATQGCMKPPYNFGLDVPIAAREFVRPNANKPWQVALAIVAVDLLSSIYRSRLMGC